VIGALLAAAGVFSGGGDSVDFHPFNVGSDVPDLDARGEKLAFLAPKGGEATEIRRLDLETGKSALWADTAPKHQGLDMGINTSGGAVLVYSRCAPVDECDLYTKPFNGDPKLLPASKPGCSETRPSMWSGLVLFARRGSSCSTELLLTPAGSDDPKHVAGGSLGADLNNGTAVMLSPAGELIAFDVTTAREVTRHGSLEPPAGDMFTTPLVVEGEYAYFVHGHDSRYFIARTRLPLGSSEIQHYSPSGDDQGAADKPHFAVTGDTLYTTNYPQPDGKGGSQKIVRITDPPFKRAE
jgi:hypothetical protein